MCIMKDRKDSVESNNNFDSQQPSFSSSIVHPRHKRNRMKKRMSTLLHTHVALIILTACAVLDASCVIGQIIADILIMKDELHEKEILEAKSKEIVLETFPNILNETIHGAWSLPSMLMEIQKELGVGGHSHEDGHGHGPLDQLAELARIPWPHSHNDSDLFHDHAHDHLHIHSRMRRGAGGNHKHDMLTDSAKYRHYMLHELTHAFHLGSMVILTFLVLITYFKIFIMGKKFLHHKIEVFDAFVITVSWALDLVFWEGLWAHPEDEAANIMIFILPWRVIRIVNNQNVCSMKRNVFDETNIIENMEAQKALIGHYFNLGLKYKDIVYVLQNTHGVRLSLRQLKRILDRNSFYRRKDETDIMDIVNFIMHELRGSGSLHGYRWMCEKLKCRGFRPRKEDVRLLLRLLDPEGTELRRRHRLRRRQYHSKGPNYIWHLDSYDKLRPYGICINGCIDGYSRKIIWLNAYVTSSDPRVIGGYYVEAVKKFSGCPIILRGDRGTENTNVCEFQRFLRRNGEDAFNGDRSFMYGRSTSNQRIESWWGFLRRECVEFWLALFDQLKADGYFDGSFLDKNLVLFCFLPIIQNELDSTVEVWNSHRIRPSTNQNVPHGRPDIMFSVPELYSVQDYIFAVDEEELQICGETTLQRSGYSCDEDVYNMCLDLMAQHGLNFGRDAYQNIDLYLELRGLIEQIMP